MSIQKIIGNLVGCLSLCRCKSSCCGNKIVLEYEGHGVDPHTENHSSDHLKTVDIIKPTIHTPSPILKHHFLRDRIPQGAGCLHPTPLEPVSTLV